MSGHHLLTGEAIGRMMDVATSPYPPSFDNNPVIFAWALFARLLILLLAVATNIRIASCNKAERIASNHPVYYHRMMVRCFLWAATCGALSDVMTYLFWGEVSNSSTAIILLISRLLDAVTMIPFLMALFVPIWARWLVRIGILKTAPTIRLSGMVNDVRATWVSATVPLQLVLYSGFASAFVTAGKYALWVRHGAH